MRRFFHQNLLFFVAAHGNLESLGFFNCHVQLTLTLKILTPQRPGYFEDLNTPAIEVRSPFHWRVQPGILRVTFFVGCSQIFLRMSTGLIGAAPRRGGVFWEQSDL